jgi:uncharacterized membrane protein YeaQ/YmgE (transglycosylase-associated protein family)
MIMAPFGSFSLTSGFISKQKPTTMNLLIFLLVGAVAGWLAGKIMKGGGFGLLWNILLGIIGGIVGGWLFDFLGIVITSGIVGSLITALVGAVVVLFIAGLFKK